LRFGVRRPRPPDPAEAIGRCGYCGRTHHDRPGHRNPGAPLRAPLLRFSSPSAQFSRVARCSGWQPAIRTIPLRPFRVRRARAMCEPSSAYAVPLRVFAVSEIGSGIARLMDECRGGSFDRRQRAVPQSSVFEYRWSRIRRSRRRDPRRHRHVAPSAAGVTDPRARGASSQVSHAAVGDCVLTVASAISPLEPGHAPTRPLARCSATRRSSHPRPSRTRGSSLFSAVATRWSHPPLVRRRSWGCALRRFDPVDGWSRRTSAAAKSVVATFLPDRAHVSFAPPRPHPIDFRRADRPPIGNRCDRKKAAIGELVWRRLLGFAPVCGPDA